MQYIIDTDKPFTGSVQSVIKDDGTVAYSDGLTFLEYNACHGGTMRLIERAELDAMVAGWNASLVTNPEPVSEEDYCEALYCLPPSRYTTTARVVRFCMAERMTGELTSWYFKAGERYFSFTDSVLATDQYIDAKIDAAICANHRP